MTHYIQKDPQAPSLKSDFIRNWLLALYYGEYKQTQGMLVFMKEEDFKYCCLGLSCLVFGLKPENIQNPRGKVEERRHFKYGFDNSISYLPYSVSSFLEVDDNFTSFKRVTNEIGNILPHTKADKLRSGGKNFNTKFFSEEAMDKTISLADLNDDMHCTFIEIALVLHKLVDSFIPKLTQAEIDYVKSTKLEGKHDA